MVTNQNKPLTLSAVQMHFNASLKLSANGKPMQNVNAASYAMGFPLLDWEIPSLSCSRFPIVYSQ